MQTHEHRDMSTETSFLDTPLTAPLIEPEKTVYLPEGEIDPRIKLLSHSSRSSLNKCPRKFQLYRLSSLQNEGEEEKDMYQQLTFDYGSTVGVGIQALLEHKDYDKTIMEMLAEWGVDLLARNDRQKKSFWEAIVAVDAFKKVIDDGYLDDYELLYFDHPKTGVKTAAIELAFKIELPNGYAYRGFIDAVLKHKVTGAVLVLELKTTSFRQVNPAMYKNSGQALGYSVILDLLFPSLSSYTVLYLVYSSTSREYTDMPFDKSAQQRAQWLTELLIDTKKIDMYEDFELYPMNGDFCYDFFHDCEYLGLCGLSTERLTKPLTAEILGSIASREEKYDFVFEFNKLIAAQIDKSAT